MKIITPSYTILRPCALDAVARKDALHAIAGAARTCYKSTGTDDAMFVAQLVRSGHEAMLEHYSLTVRFVVDRGVSHEIVRHRMASYAQESTRYCNYGKGKFGGEISVICPKEIKNDKIRAEAWEAACGMGERIYLALIGDHVPPELARSVLPHALATEIVMTANLREWRHFLALRAVGTTGKPHPQIRQVALPLLHELADWMPEVFTDIDKQTRADDVTPECVHVVVPRPKPAAKMSDEEFEAERKRLNEKIAEEEERARVQTAIKLPGSEIIANTNKMIQNAKKELCRGMY